jgi:hypothetical protein
MGSTYAVGLKASKLQDDGFDAAAKYINASTSEIGYTFSTIYQEPADKM